MVEAQVASHQNIVGAVKIWKGLFKTRKLPMVELSTQFVELFDVWHMHFFQKAITAASTNAPPRRLSWLNPVLRNRMKKPVEQEIVDEKALYSWKFHVLSHKWCSSSN